MNLFTTLRGRLLMLFGALLAGTVYYILSGLVADWLLLRQWQQITAIERSAVAVSAVVHELQKERGMSAGFIGSKGAKFAAELPRQRELTDGKRKELDTTIGALGQDALPPTLKAKLTDGIDNLKKLGEKRQQISGLNLTGPESFAFYPNSIERLLDELCFSTGAFDMGWRTRELIFN